MYMYMEGYHTTVYDDTMHRGTKAIVMYGVWCPHSWLYGYMYCIHLSVRFPQVISSISSSH